MKFIPTKIKGVFIIELEKREDDRGFFARTFCADEFVKMGLDLKLVQGNMSFSKKKGTLRGMHIQTVPHQEAKLVRCTKGALFDIALDLRPTSPTFKQWVGFELTEDNYKMLYLSEGTAHGFITLKDNTEVSYLVSHAFTPGSEKGYRYNDPAFSIKLPIEVTTISEKDNSWENYK